MNDHEIDRVLSDLTASCDVELTRRGSMSSGARVEVGYFELRRLVAYIEEQQQNFRILERCASEVADLAGNLRSFK